MQRLAAAMREQMDSLVEEYSRRLSSVPQYEEMPEALRAQYARFSTSLLIAYLESGDDDLFIGYVREIAKTRLEQGVSTDSFQQAVTILEELVRPLIDNTELALQLWATFSKVYKGISGQIAITLSASENETREFVERLPLGIFRITPDGRAVAANAAFLDIVGYESVEAIDRVGVPALYEDAADRERLFALLQQGPVSGFETRFRRADGVIDVSMNVRAVYEGETLRHLEGIIEDVTARKEAEVTLRESEERFRTVIESAQAGIFILNDTFQFVYVNDQLSELLGYSLDELLGRDFRTVLDEESKALVADRYVRRQRGEEVPSRYEFRVVRKDGEKRWVEVNSTTSRDAAGKPRTIAHILDITERKRIEEQVLEERNFSDAIINSLPGVFYLLDSHGHLQRWNQRYEEVTGYTANELERLSSVLMIADEDRQQVTATMQQVYAEGSGTTEALVLTKNGDKIPFYITGRRLWVGDEPYIVGTGIDISQQKQAELRFRTLFDTANDAIFLMQGDRFVDCNAKTLEIFAAERDQVLGQSPVNFSPPYQPDGVDSLLKAGEHIQAALAGEPQMFYWQHIRYDGTPFDAEVSLNRVEVGGEVLLQAIVRDITERQRAEAELRRSEERFRRMASSIHDGLTILEGNQVVYVNDRLCEIFGYEREELMRMSSLDLAAPEERERITQIMKEVRRKGTPLEEIEYWVVRRDGTRRYVQNRYSMIRENDQIVGRVVVTSDYTERRLQEQEQQEEYQRRVREVQLGVEIAQEIAAAPSLDELFRRVVTLVKEQFGYYHAQIFRHDPERNAMVVVESYGEPGERLKAASHHLTYGKGVVGTAAESGLPVLASDVRKDKDWLPNPHLPHTQGELAVPIKLRDQVLGVLDVQSDVAGALSDQDQILLLGLAGQIATAMESTRLLEEANTFRQLTESSGEGIGIATLSGEIVYVNPTLRRLLGETRNKDVLGKQIIQYYPPDIQHRVMEEVLPTVIREGLWRGELALLARTGEVTPTLENFSIIRSEYGAPRYLVDIITDITTQKRTEADLQDRLAELSTLYQAMGREGWESLRREAEMPGGYFFDRLDLRLANDLWLPEMAQAIEDKAVARSAVAQQGDKQAVILPMMVHDEAIGVLGVYDNPDYPLSTDEIALLEAVSAQVALALDNARLFSQTQSALAEVQATHRSYLRGEWHDYLRRRALLREGGFLYDQVQVNPVVDLWRPEIEQVLSKRTPVTVQHDEDGDPRSGLAIPITLRGQVIGVLGVEDPDGSRTWAQEELELLREVGEQLGLALENARLLDDTRLRAERERMVGEITAKVRAASDLETLLSTAVREVGLALDPDRTLVQLVSTTRDDLDVDEAGI